MLMKNQILGRTITERTVYGIIYTNHENYLRPIGHRD